MVGRVCVKVARGIKKEEELQNELHFDL